MVRASCSLTVRRMNENSSPNPISRHIARGAAVNAFGLISKALSTPLLYILLTRLFGKVPLGTFMIAYNFIEIVGALGTSGFVDGGILYASRHAHREEDRQRLHAVIRSLLGLTLGTGLFLLAFVLLGAPFLVNHFYPDYPGLTPALQVLAFTLPFESLTRIAVSLPKAHLKMGPEVLVLNIIAPGITMALAVLFYLLGWKAVGISASFAITYVITLLIAVRYVQRMLDLRSLLRKPEKPEPIGPILAFVIPQNLNQALNRFISSMDVVMLGAMGAGPGDVAFYGLGAQIVRNVRQVKLVFSGSYNPVVARYHHEGRLTELNDTLALVSRWSIALGMPALFAASFFRRELLQLFDPRFTQDPVFMLFLLVNPFLSCAFGMAGNVLVMAGYSRWNLFNSLLIGALNFMFNLVMIPRFGLLGAAAATALAGIIVSTLQVIEAKALVRIHVPWAAILPWISLGLLLFGWPFAVADKAAWWVKLLVALPLLALYAGLYFRGRLFHRAGN